MKKVGLLFREALENRIRSYLKESSSIFIIRYSKLHSLDLSILRQSLRNSSARLFVAKNTIVKRALCNLRLDSLVKFIEGPCGLVFIKNDPVNASRVLYNFFKKNEQLKLEGGILGDRILNSKDIEILAKLPSKEILRIQVAMAIKSPIQRLALVLNQPLIKFVWCLNQIKNKKGDC